MKGEKTLRVVPVDSNTQAPQDATLASLPDADQGNQNPAPSQNPPIDDTLAGLPDDTTPLHETYKAVASADPDHAAAVIKTADQTGVSDAYAANNLNQMQKAMKAPPVSFFSRIESDYPGTTKFLSDPRVMAATHDDLPNVVEHEGLIQQAKNAFGSGALQEDLAFTQYNKAFGNPNVTESDAFRTGGYAASQYGITTTNPDERIKQINEKLQEIEKSKPQSLLGRAFYGAGEFLPQIGSQIGYAAKYALPAAGVGAVAGLAAGPAAPAVEAFSIPAMAGVGAATGDILYNYRMMTGMSYDQMSKVRDVNGQPLPDNVMKIASAATGAVASGLGLVKLGAVLESVPGGKEFLSRFTSQAGEKVLEDPATYSTALRNFTQNYVRGVAHGAGAMVGISATNIAGERAAEALSGQTFDHSQDPGVVSDLASTAGDAALTFGALGLFGGGVGLTKDMLKARKTEAAQNFITALGDTAKDSKLRERLPYAHKALVDQLTKDGPVENVFIPVEAAQSYFQSKNLDADQVMQELGVSKSYDEAKATGGNVQIPLSTFVDKLAGTEHYQGLSQDIKFDPEDFTPRELESRKSEIQAQMKELADKMKAQEAGAPTEGPSVTEVYNTIKSKLEESGLSLPEVENGARVHEAFFTTFGKHLGVDPQELMNKFPLEVNGPESDISPEEKLASQPDFLDTENAKELNQSGVRLTSTGRLIGSVPDEAGELSPKDLKNDLAERAVDAGVVSDKKEAKAALTKKGLRRAEEKEPTLAEKVRARYGDEPFADKMFEKAKAQAEKANETYAPLMNGKKHLAFYPNESVAPTGVIGNPKKFSVGDPEKIFRNAEQLNWHDTKYGLTKSLIKQHGEQGIPLTINTSSDLISHDDYIEALPKDAKVNIVLPVRGEERALGDGLPSDQRLLIAYDKLKKLGIDATVSVPDPETKTLKQLDPFTVKRLQNEKNGFWEPPTNEETSYDQAPTSKFKQVTPEEFAKLRDTSSRNAWLTPYTPDEMKDFKLFMSDDGVGFAIKPDGDLVNIFNNSGKKGAGAEAIAHGIEQGAKKLDCVGDYLAGRYNEAGFVLKHVDAWNDAYAPKDWDYEKQGRPNIYYFEFPETLSRESGDTAKRIELARAEKSARLAGTRGPLADLQFHPDHPFIDWSAWRGLGSAESPVSSGRPEEGSRVLEQGSDSDARGRIRFGANKQFSISLFEKADKSTFLHESGHYFLEVMGHLASEENAPEQLKKDYQTLLDWFGVKSKDEIGTDQHEQFARGFEAYLMEGKAPSERLQAPFDRFRNWLVSIYRHMKNLNVNLTDDVRGVMDRMLATEDEINEAKRSIGISDEPLPNVPPELEGKTKDLQAKARDLAERQLLKEQMAETTVKHKDFLDAERKRLTDVAEKQVDEMPLFKATDEVKSNVSKFKDPGTIAEKFLAGKLKDHEAAQFETIAETHGFADGEDLAKQIVMSETMGSRDQEIKSRVDAGMASHADLKDTDAIKLKALEAIHNEKMTELLALERETLAGLINRTLVNNEVSRRNRLEARIEAQAARDQARQMLSDKPIKDSGNSRIYVTAERKAAEKAARALAKKDYEAAAEAKRQQLLNHALASEAMKNKAEADKAVSYLSDFAKRKNDLKGAPYGFTRQIDQLLAKFGLSDQRQEDSQTLIAIAKDMAAKGQDPADIANATGHHQDANGNWVPETLSDFVTRVNENNYAIILPDSVVNAADRPFNERTLSELRDLKNAVKTISEVGKKYDKFLEFDRKSDIKNEAARLKKTIEENYGAPQASSLAPGSAHASNIGELLEIPNTVSGAATRFLDNMLAVCDKLDGYKKEGVGKTSAVEGPAKDNIYRPLKEAEDRKIVRTKKALGDLDAIFAKHYTDHEFDKYKTTRVNIDGRFFTKEEILSMLLNRGNEGNLDRLTRGFGWSVDKVDQIINTHLDKKDFDFAQDVWDHLQTYWPEITKLEMDVNGVEPKGVQAQEFQSKFGSYKGGYYPIAYDFEKSADALKNTEERTALYKQFSTAAAHTDQGHAQARAQSVGRPIRLSLDVLADHHENVIHDIEFRRAVIDVTRFLNQPDAKASITNAFGVKGYGNIVDWVKSVASSPAEPVSELEKAVRWFRLKGTLSMLGWRLVSVPKIAAENYVNTAREVGLLKAIPTATSGAFNLVKSYLSDSEMHTTVMEKSSFMRQRADHLDRDMGDVVDKWRGTKDSALKRFAFATHAMTDQAFTVPLWYDTYKRAIAEHGDERLAVNQADEVIKRRFMSGSAVDQAKVMRGSELQKTLTIGFGFQAMQWSAFSREMSQASREWQQGNKLDSVMIGARSAVYAFALPAIVVALSREMTRNKQSSNDDETEKRLAATMVEEGTPLKFIPIIRDLVPAGIRMAQGQNGVHFQATPLEGAAENLLMPAADLFHAAFSDEHDLSGKFPEHAISAVSFASGVPKSVNDAALNFMDWMGNNGELTWRDFLSRRAKK